MQLEVQNTQLQDQILSTLVEKTNYSLFDLGQAYKKLRSFDLLLSVISKATEQRRSLSDMVDVLMEGNSN